MIKIIIYYTFFILIIIASALIWPYINLTYEESSIISEYNENKYNQNTDLIRYLIFIAIPSLLCLIYHILNKRFALKILLEKLKTNNEDNNKIYLFKDSLLIYFIFNLFLLLEFLSVNFPLNIVDTFHEGQQMSGAFKYYLTDSLWSGSYVTVGIIYEVISSQIIWNFLDSISIGSSRFLNLLYIFFLKILLVLLSYQIVKISKIKPNFFGIFFIFLAYIFSNLISYQTQLDQLIFREIPVVLTLIIFFEFIIGKKYFKNLVIFFGPISCFAIFFSFDRGIVVNLIILVFLIHLVFTKQIKFIILVLLSILFSWTSSYIYLADEFNYFVVNTLSILKEINQIGGIIHPIPFSNEANSSRATKSLFLISLSIIVSLDLIFKEKSIFSKNFTLILLIISILSFLSYGYALGRSDGPHIKSSFGFIIIFYSSIVIYYILNLISKSQKIFFKNIDNQRFYILILFNLILFLPSIDLKNISSYQKRFENYINLKDYHFLKTEDKNFIKNSKKIIQNHNCVQLFTNEVLILYLLRKANCSKFYFPITIGSNENQKFLIEKLKNTQIIIADNDESNFSPSFRLPLVKDYINKNYTLVYNDKKWKILKIND